MKWTYEWLREYLDTDYSAEEICDTLNRTGLEVEDFVSPVPPIAAKIVECRPHENSDHLHVLMVDDGSGKLRQIVCGAPNVRVGMVSALARPGLRRWSVMSRERVSLRRELLRVMCSRQLGRSLWVWR